MARFRFYATEEESLRFLQELLDGGDLRVVLGQQTLDAPSPTMYPALTPGLRRELHESPMVYLYGPHSTHPPYLAKLTSGPNAGRYFLSDADGGPHVLFRLGYVIDGTLAEGALWTQPHYQLTDTLFTGPTPALKAAYADMVKRLKQHLVRWEGLWISPGALQLLKGGQAELPGDLKPLGILARKAKDLPTLGPAVPATSRKTAKRHAAARSARAE